MYTPVATTVASGLRRSRDQPARRRPGGGDGGRGGEGGLLTVESWRRGSGAGIGAAAADGSTNRGRAATLRTAVSGLTAGPTVVDRPVVSRPDVGTAGSTVDGVEPNGRPQVAQVLGQPRVRMPQVGQRPGGATSTRTDAIGPSTAPNRVQAARDRPRSAASRPAMAANTNAAARRTRIGRVTGRGSRWDDGGAIVGPHPPPPPSRRGDRGDWCLGATLLRTCKPDSACFATVCY